MMNTPSTATAQVSVHEHLSLVTKVAKKVARRLPRVVDVDDLIGAGTIGLIDAASRFDSSRSDNFAAYAEIRIRGAILDQLRAMDWLPRSQRAKTRRADAAEHTLQRELGRAPSADELATHMGVTTTALGQLGRGVVVSIEDLHSDGFDGFDSEAPTAAHTLETRDRKEKLAAAIAKMPLRAQQLLSLYYVEELTLKQIGSIFGVSESRVCQLHTQAVAKLRTALIDDVELR